MAGVDTGTILIVDDEPAIGRALRVNLSARGYQTIVATTGADALRDASQSHPDVIVLDLGLPDIDGVDVIHGIRGWSATPIIVLSARGEEAAKVAALDAGADDYVTKPFGMEELLARLRAALRRRLPEAESALVETDDFTIDLADRRVRRDGAEVHLTPTEWHVLELLVRSAGKLVTQKQILHEVWGPQYDTESNYVRLYVAQLRRKLEPTPSSPRYIRTEPGVGYRFYADREPDS